MVVTRQSKQLRVTRSQGRQQNRVPPQRGRTRSRTNNAGSRLSIEEMQSPVQGSNLVVVSPVEESGNVTGVATHNMLHHDPQSINHIAVCRMHNKTMYLPAHFLPVHRADKRLEREKHTNSALTRHWQNRWVASPFEPGTEDANAHEILECFNAQCAIRREFRKLCDNHVKALYVADSVGAGIKNADRQNCMRFSDVVEACKRLYNKTGPADVVLQTRNELFQFKYHSQSFKTGWEKDATERVLEENNLKIRDTNNMVVGVRKSCFVKLMSIALTKIRSRRLCVDLKLTRPQEPIFKEVGGVLTDTGKRKRNRIRKADTTFDPEVNIKDFIDLTEADGGDLVRLRKVTRTGSEINAAVRAHFNAGGEPIKDIAGFELIIGTEHVPVGVPLISPTRLDGGSFNDASEQSQRAPRAMPAAQRQLPTRLPPRASTVLPSDGDDSVSEHGMDDSTETDESELAYFTPPESIVVTEAREAILAEVVQSPVDEEEDDSVYDDGTEKCCGKCLLTEESSAFSYRLEQYWLNGMVCNGKKEEDGRMIKCGRVFNEDSVKRNETLMVCRESRIWKNQEERIRCCNVIYCLTCLPNTGRGRRSRRGLVVAV